MARPLRDDVDGGWYHVMSRGIERRAIFHGVGYYEHFLELLGEMSEQWCVEVHAYCLMRNHYHLILRTPEANASQSMQWLNVSYAAWFNARRQRVGHVFQGRFKSKLIDGDGAWLLLASEYVHLNPVRTARSGLDKRGQRVEGQGLREPTADEVKARLEPLRKHRWSSYGAYAGYAAKPHWLQTGVILGRSGGKQRYRDGVGRYVTGGADPDAFESLQSRVAIGSVEFVEQVKQRVGKPSKEQPDRHFVRRLVDFQRVVCVVEDVTGKTWEEFGLRYGDAYRNVVLYLARQRCGLTLKALGQKAGGMDYKTVGKAVKRCEAVMKKDRTIRTLVKTCIDKLATFET